MAQKKVKCFCGGEVGVSGLRRHLSNGLAHWSGKGFTDNALSPFALDFLVEQIKMGKHTEKALGEAISERVQTYVELEQLVKRWKANV